jgi:hypothetical protein
LVLVAAIASAAYGGPSVIDSHWAGPNGGGWSYDSYWDPSEVPNNYPGATFNVTIAWDSNGDLFNGPVLDQAIIVDNLNLVNRAYVNNQGVADPVYLYVNGTTTFSTTPGHDGELGVLWAFDDCVLQLGTLTNFNPTTKTYTGGWLGSFRNGQIGFRAADIRINKGVLSVGGLFGRIYNQENNANALSNLQVNDGQLFFSDGANHFISSPFTNNGGLVVSSGGNQTTMLTSAVSLTNYNVGTHTLTGGYYEVNSGENGGTATFRFPAADVWTINNATIVLDGPNAAITDTNGNNAFRNLSGISGGTFTSSGTVTLTPAGGTLNNNGATHNITKGAQITVNGNVKTMNGAQTNLGQPADNNSTRLTINGNAIIENGGFDFGGTPGVNTQYHTELEVRDGIEFRGAYLTGTGTTFADVGLIHGSVFSPGHSPGQITIEGSLSLGTSEDQNTTIVIEIAGTEAGTEFDQIVQSGGDGVTLAGTLQVVLLDDFQYRIRGIDRFEILTSDQEIAGEFSNVANGERVFTQNGHGAFIASYGPDADNPDRVVLDSFLPIGITVLTRIGGNIVVHGKGVPDASHTILRADEPGGPFKPLDTVFANEAGEFEYEDPIPAAPAHGFYAVVGP